MEEEEGGCLAIPVRLVEGGLKLDIRYNYYDHSKFEVAAFGIFR